MGKYRDLDNYLKGKERVKILLLDSVNIQFYYQHKEVIPNFHIFEPFDLVLIPGWVHAEYVHHEGKVIYIASLPKPYIILDEVDDYLPMVGYSDKRLLELFRIASPHGESQRFFNQLKRVEAEELPDDWIDQFYEHGFHTTVNNSMVLRKNAGDVSILALCFLLLSHYPMNISHIAIATNDFGFIRLKEKIVDDGNKASLDLGISSSPPISFMSIDSTIFKAVQDDVIQTDIIHDLRPNACSSIYAETFSDGTNALHKHVLETPALIKMCTEHHRYKIIF